MSSRVGSKVYEKKVTIDSFTTVRLQVQKLIGHKHYDAGSVITVGNDIARTLIEKEEARKVVFNPDAVPLPSQPKAMRTAEAVPATRKAATVTGRTGRQIPD